MKKSSIFLFALASIAYSTSVGAQDTNVNQTIDDLLGDHTKYQTVIHALQKAVSAHDANAVAGLVSYPIGVKVHGKEVHIKTAKDFAQHYDGIMTPAITKAITSQKYEDLFVNYKGIMFGNGQIWINGICHDNQCKNFDVKVIAIQEPS